MSIIDIALAVVVGGLIGVVLLLLLMFLCLVVDRIFKREILPYCDINPRCHPSYRDGWIGNIKVRE